LIGGGEQEKKFGGGGEKPVSACRFAPSFVATAALKKKLLAGAAEWTATPFQLSYNQRSID
jgi:hypothetical protein